MKKIALAISLSTFAVGANATIIGDGVSGGNLQWGLNNITQGGSFYDVDTSQASPDEVFKVGASGGSFSRLVFEFAGFANTNSFGIYDIGNLSNSLEIFDGAAAGSANDYALSLNLSGSTFSVLSSSGIGGSSTFTSNLFGYYLDSANGDRYYSQAALNTDVSDAAHGLTTDHMVAFAGDGVTMLDIDGDGTYGVFGGNEYILGWEDLRFPGSDYDYSDMVVLVESVKAVPAPATLALFGLGLLGLGAASRKRKQA